MVGFIIENAIDNQNWDSKGRKEISELYEEFFGYFEENKILLKEDLIDKIEDYSTFIRHNIMLKIDSLSPDRYVPDETYGNPMKSHEIDWMELLEEVQIRQLPVLKQAMRSKFSTLMK